VGDPYTWVDPATTVQVQSPAALSFQAASTAVMAGAAASNIIVDIEVFASDGTRVAQQIWSGQSFAAAQARTYSVGWSSRRQGTYTVKIGVFGAGWTPMYLWQNQAASFTVQ
jgi:hypothetical protein